MSAPTVAGRYRLERRLAHREDAEVWEGTDTVLGRPVLVELGGDARHAVALARLRHPGILALFDSGTDEAGRPFAVTEAARGPTLAELARPDGLPVARAVPLLVQVADALAHAHAAGICHGAIRADAVVCTEAGAKLGDFRGVAADAAAVAADLRALGAVAFEALCGRPPAGLRPRQVRAGIPRTLDELVVAAIEGRVDTAAAFRAELAAIDTADDDAVVLTTTDDTPPQGTPPSFRQTERVWLLPAAAIAVVALAMVLAGLLVARTDIARTLLPGRTPQGAAGPLRLASLQVFDPPPGDGHERDADVGLAADGNPATAWRTQRYTRPDLGGLKPGVGLVLRLDRPHRLDRLIVRSPTRGWSATVYAAEPATTLAGWGTPVVTASGIDGDATFDLRGRTASAVLVWITRLGPVPGGWAAAVSEVVLTGR